MGVAGVEREGGRGGRCHQRRSRFVTVHCSEWVRTAGQGGQRGQWGQWVEEDRGFEMVNVFEE